jgi:hypothetical protein
VAFALPDDGMLTAGCPAGSPAAIWSLVSVDACVELVAAGAAAAGAAAVDLATVVPSRNPRMAPRRSAATASRLAMAQVVDWSATDTLSSDTASEEPDPDFADLPADEVADEAVDEVALLVVLFGFGFAGFGSSSKKKS